MKQERLGWDFLLNTCVRKVKEKRDDNKEVYPVDTIYNSAGHNNLNVNIKEYNKTKRGSTTNILYVV